MDTIERLRVDAKNLTRGQIEALADKMGVPRGTFRSIVSGATPDPRYSTVKKIAQWYIKHDMGAK